MKKLIIAYLFTITNVFGAPPTYFNGELQTNTYIQNIKAPNYQTTPLGGIDRRLETGNLNELQNPNFEHSTVGMGWTISNATISGNTANPLEGKKSISLALTGALSLSQSSTINAAQKSGVQMVASVWVNSTDVSDLQLCSLKNGSEDKCTVTGGYVQGSGWRQLTVSFIGNATSNGLKLKSTDTTGTVLVDQAFVGVGSPIVDFTPDMVYSAKVSSAGVVTGENTDWINGTCSTVTGSQNFGTTCNFASNIFTVAPNCLVSLKKEYAWTGGIQTVTNSSVSYTVSSAGSGSAGTDVYLICQKQGADYKTSKAYVASGSVALNTTVYSATINGASGAVSGENTDWINGNCSANGSSPYQVDCALITGVFTSAPNCTISHISPLNDSQVSTVTVRFTNLSTSQLRFTQSFNGIPSTVGDVKVICQKQGADYQAAFNPVIVGSFQGYNETPGTSRVETFSVSYGTTNATTVCSASPCSYLDQIGNAVTSITRSSAGLYTINTTKTYSKLKCAFSGEGVGGYLAQANGASCSNCNALPLYIRTSQSSGFNDAYGTIVCQGIPQ